MRGGAAAGCRRGLSGTVETEPLNRYCDSAIDHRVQPSPGTATKPCPQVPRLRVFRTPPGTATPPPWAACCNPSVKNFRPRSNLNLSWLSLRPKAQGPAGPVSLGWVPGGYQGMGELEPPPLSIVSRAFSLPRQSLAAGGGRPTLQSAPWVTPCAPAPLPRNSLLP